jgi:hypothetical protein
LPLPQYPFFAELWRQRVPLFERLSLSSTSLNRLGPCPG